MFSSETGSISTQTMWREVKELEQKNYVTLGISLICEANKKKALSCYKA